MLHAHTHLDFETKYEDPKQFPNISSNFENDLLKFSSCRKYKEFSAVMRKIRYDFVKFVYLLLFETRRNNINVFLFLNYNRKRYVFIVQYKSHNYRTNMTRGPTADPLVFVTKNKNCNVVWTAKKNAGNTICRW